MKPENLASGKPAEPEDLLLRRRAALVTPHINSGHQSMLDAGCGNGAQTFWFNDYFKDIVGLDIDPQFLEAFINEAAARGVHEKYTTRLYAGDTFPFPDRAFDFTTSFEVLEHVENEALFLTELFRTLRPGGILAISVPNRWWIFETHGAELPLLPWNRVPFFSWLPGVIHDRYARARIYREKEIATKLAGVGFEITDSTHITAPMDAVKNRKIQEFLRLTLFRKNATSCPFLATSILIIAKRPPLPEMMI